MSISIVRPGSPRQKGEGLRIGTVRRPPRGVAKDRFAADDWYDVWYPELSPSAELVKLALAATTDKEWAAFVRAFRKEMDAPAARHTLDLLAALSHSADLSVGCYCENENRCHRSVLRKILEEREATIAWSPTPTQ
ncbi:MAG: DUF488 family protein [Rhodospirillaceae bacterium]|jgi:uncharacterized protein YeaO (DUF488 family)|nr:DUF488 family protein [Rhodospirillaceae bacterium]MBT6509371.1 DUF488 family protein [Rhodospirillaceae bacterium]MBT7615282.1 DUF488 family protein [Rhodospirillaceae bacterium]MBT7646841.1 DUF488 family protein [Rhodospirillaceae bacterium]